MRPDPRRYWMSVALYIVVLFALQPRLGFWVDAFKERWGSDALERSVMLVLGLAGTVMIGLLVVVWRRATTVETLLLLAALGLYGWGVMALEIPQERLHYLEYGVLSALLFGAWTKPERTRWRAAGLAIVTTVAIGYVDEVLQGWLWERRYFSWADVAINARAALLGVMVAAPLLGKL